MQPTGHTTSVQYDPLALMELWWDLERTKYPKALDLLPSAKNIYYLTPINLFLCKQGLFCQFHLPKKKKQNRSAKNQNRSSRKLISSESTSTNFGRAPPPPLAQFLHFHTVFRKFWPKNNLASPFALGTPREILDPSLHFVARKENEKQRYPKKFILCQMIKSSGSESNYRSILDYIQLNPQMLWFMMIIRSEYTSFIELLSAGPKVHGKRQDPGSACLQSVYLTLCVWRGISRQTYFAIGCNV